MHPVDEVIAGHDGPRLGLLDGNLEGFQIQLSQGPLTGVDVHGESAGLLFIGGKMLDRGANPLALDAHDVTRREPTREERVLGERLEVSATQRGPV